MMEAGRELDALVAEKVMGWTTEKSYVHGPLMHGGGMMLLYKGDGASHDGFTWSVDAFQPSIKIEAAWEVVEKMREAAWTFQLDNVGFNDETEGKWRVLITTVKDVHVFIDGATAPHAICLAALEAID